MKENHVTWEEIVELIETGKNRTNAAREHVEKCTLCQRMVAEVRALKMTFEIAARDSPSESLIEQTLESLRKEFETGQKQFSTGIREIWATLVSSAPQPSPALRGFIQADKGVLVFQSDELDVSLSITSDQREKGLNLLGQLLPKNKHPESITGRVELRAGNQIFETNISDFGTFNFKGVQREKLQITVEIGELRIRLTPFSLSAKD